MKRSCRAVDFSFLCVLRKLFVLEYLMRNQSCQSEGAKA